MTKRRRGEKVEFSPLKSEFESLSQHVASYSHLYGRCGLVDKASGSGAEGPGLES